MINSSGTHRGEKHCHHMPFANNTLISSFQEILCEHCPYANLGPASPSLTPILNKPGFFQWKQHQAMNGQVDRDGTGWV